MKMGSARKVASCLCASLVALIVQVQGLVTAQTIDEGVKLFQQNKFAEAKSVFEQIIKTDGANAEAYYRLGLVYFNRAYAERDVDKAVDQLEEAVELNPNNADYQFMYGAMLGEKVQHAGLIKQALLAPKVKSALSRAVELNPKNIQARIGLAQYYLRAPSILGGDEEEGWKQLDEIIKLDEVPGRLVKASSLAHAKKYDDAEKEFKKLVSIKPKEWRVWKGYGALCIRIERYNEAINHFQKYIELRPDTADSYNSLAEALLKKGEVEQALTDVKKSLDLDDEFVPAIITLGEIYQVKGQKKEAKETYQKAVSVAKNEYYKKQAEEKLESVE